jgi:fructose-bisphosphate aldolase class II
LLSTTGNFLFTAGFIFYNPIDTKKERVAAMLVNLKEILKIASKKNWAIGSFNTPNLEPLMAVLNSAEKNDLPVIIAHAQLHESVMPLDIIGPIMVSMARKSSVPVCVHLDHGEDLDYIGRALDMGFTSVMFDGSLLSYEENVRHTLRACWLARQYNASVEGEIGAMGSREGSEGEAEREALYTDPDTALRFVRDTGIDALACSFGTVHGFYKSKPKLDFERIKKINELTKIPLVMHGGSGVSAEDYTRAINCGIRKINYYSYMSLAGVNSVKERLNNVNGQEEVKFFHDLALIAAAAMEKDVERAMKVFYAG